MKKSRTRQKKRPKHRGSPAFEPPNPLYASIAQREKETVIEIIRAGRTGEKAREVGLSAQVWGDHALRQFEWTHDLPHPITCTPGCDHCCYNQVEVTPPEALVIGHFLEGRLAPAQRDPILAKVEKWLEKAAGKGKAEIARRRLELPCPLLHEHGCIAYPVRPLVCRAMHSLDAAKCEASLKNGDLAAAPYYAERHELVLALVQGLQAGCRTLGCQSGVLDLAQALQDYFRLPEAAERWIKGQPVFTL